MKITVDEVVYDVVKEKEINGKCTGCFLKGNGYVNCLEITNIDCMVEKIIFLKVPDSLKCCENCNHFGEYSCPGCKNYSKWEESEW